MHPSYNNEEVAEGYDLAILELAYAPHIDTYTRPVCLGTEESLQETLDLGEKAECYITGFGATELYLVTGKCIRGPYWLKHTNLLCYTGNLIISKLIKE